MSLLGDVVASIPSPDNGVIEIGPVPLHMYGVMIALGVLVAARVGRTRYIAKATPAEETGAVAETVARARGDAFDSVAFWAVVGGIVGARLYHVVTDFQLFEDHLERIPQIWKGGLSIWGGVLGGAIAVLIVARRRSLVFADLADSIVPGLAFAQAIGRWGNYFNQELFGGPSTLPWAVEISREHRPTEYLDTPTFHPTFLYESLWCAALGFALLYIDRRVKLARGQLFALYAAGYTPFRLVMEQMRTDPANTIGPLRVNAWVSIIVFIGAVVAFFWLGRRARGRVDVTDGNGEVEVSAS